MSSTRSIEPRRPRPIIANPSYQYPRGGSRGRSRAAVLILVVALIVLVSAVVLGGLYWTVHRAQQGTSRPVLFHVGSGDTVTTVASRLNRRGLISNPLLFRFDARLQGLGGKLKVGDYRLRGNMSIDQAVAALTVYHARSLTVTIPEGYRIDQTAQLLDRRGLDGRQFLVEAKHPADLHFSVLGSKPPGASLEGFLFPNTYDIPPGHVGKALARLMVKTLDQTFSAARRQRAAAEHMSILQVLTLASIVEREARVPSERPTIASVYMNRLRIGMPLQADPTVQYVVGTSRNWWPLLSADQLHTAGAYNTYINKGLPPGPIASPGLDSIRAVLNPAHTSFFYFVAKGHGRHAFAGTYAEQLQNQQRYSTAAK